MFGTFSVSSTLVTGRFNYYLRYSGTTSRNVAQSRLEYLLPRPSQVSLDCNALCSPGELSGCTFCGEYG